MKKIHTKLAGLMLLSVALLTSACSSADDTGKPFQELTNVVIHCKAIEMNGDLNFEIYDAKQKGIPPEDFVTIVAPGTRVTWKWDKDSDIRKFEKIWPEKPGKIMPGDAKRVPFTRHLRIEVPGDATEGEQKYLIKFPGLDGNPKTVDPYLKLPRTSSVSTDGGE